MNADRPQRQTEGAGQPEADVAGLPAAVPPTTTEVPPGGSVDLRVHAVAKRIGERVHPLLAYNGSVPGPTLVVRQGSTIEVRVENDMDLDTTVHWHGLRLENRFDGVPHETQTPIPPGGRYTHHLTFPDAGLFWYHPHVREDITQELGLYGNVVVRPADPSFWPVADREVALTLDDILLEDGRLAPFDPTTATHTAMGRFGNVLLVGGEMHADLTARRGEVVRLHLTNTANTRVFRVSLPGARMKLIGGDAGRYEHEQWVDDVVVAPSERSIVDVLLEDAGTFTLLHRTPGREYPLATITVAGPPVTPAAREAFGVLRTDAAMVAERARAARYLDTPPDRTLALVAEMSVGGPGAHVYVCPMHPEVVSDEPGSCPTCGMKLLAVAAPSDGYGCPMHPEVVSDEPGHCPKCQMKLVPAALIGQGGDGHDHEGHEHEGHGHDHAAAGGIEWEDDMVEVNRITTPANMRWKLVDRDTGDETAAIDWRFRVGDQVKIRLLNEMAGDHPMHHPFHVHGAGRVLVLSRDGVPESSLVWKDTVLVRTGETVDILLDVTNVGRWMAHCHIAEHHESGMMFSFNVEE